MTSALAPAPALDQVAELVTRARESGSVAQAELNAAFDRYELHPEAIDEILRSLADDGVEIVGGADEAEEVRRDATERARRSGTSDLVRNLRALSFGATARSRSTHWRTWPAAATPPQAVISSRTARCAGAVNTSGPMPSKAGPSRAGRCTASFSACLSRLTTGSAGS